ncbi:MAG: hypothetical protein AAFN93_03415 [Bacteroidota bacterium]
MLRLDLESDGESYPMIINEVTASLSDLLPFGTKEVTIKTIEISPGAIASKKAGDIFRIDDNPISIEVTAENNQTKQVYSLSLDVAKEPNYEALLFDQQTNNNCEVYATIDIGELKVENNLWNVGGLSPDSYSQCIYTYENEDLQLLGWQWQYPDNARGVNAYPQLIYGWKPWQPNSTTSQLPKEISKIKELKVAYDAEVTRNEGDYNLAFDCWINSSASITPQNIQFEFMVWEDTKNLVPFGDYQEDVTTTNGTYRFYMGEPDWEPPGSNWTYLAFQRVGNRNTGTVDIDELLFYLVNEGIVSEDSYLASVEFGNEVGNSTGQTIIKEFNVEFE